MVTTGQSNGMQCDSPGGADHSEACQGFGSQLEGNQGDSTIGSFCCLIGEGQAMTWDENDVLIPSPLLTGLADWASLHKDELLRHAIQSMHVYTDFCISLLCIHADFHSRSRELGA
jgi:hypothetical protein